MPDKNTNYLVRGIFCDDRSDIESGTTSFSGHIVNHWAIIVVKIYFQLKHEVAIIYKYYEHRASIKDLFRLAMTSWQCQGALLSFHAILRAQFIFVAIK